MQTIEAPTFKLSFLHPRYWPIWLACLFLYLVSWLPLPIIRRIGHGFGFLLKTLVKKRVAIARRNLELCFPDWTEQERENVLQENIDAAGMAVMETVMGWWWPDWRVRAVSEVKGLEHVQAALAKGKGILCLAPHTMSIELGCRIAGLYKPAVAFYRKHDNPLMEYLQTRGRARSNKYMIHKRDVKGMLQALSDGEISFYLPDQDYGRRRCEFVPFFKVEHAATTTGTLLFAHNADCEVLFISSHATDKGYCVEFYPGLQGFPSGDDKADVARVNRKIEELVLKAPGQYLWMHKRFKTRPNPEDPSLYR